MGELETTPSDGPSGVQSQEDHKCGHSRGERWEEEVACCQDTGRGSAEFARGALKSMECRSVRGRLPQDKMGRSDVCRKGNDLRKSDQTGATDLGPGRLRPKPTWARSETKKLTD